MVYKDQKVLLSIENLHVSAGKKEILRGVDLTILEGEVHVLLGPNGSGKSTLLGAIMGFSQYQITKGRILFRGEDITQWSIDQRAKLGLGLMFQRPPHVNGLHLSKLLEAANPTKEFTRAVEFTNMIEFQDRDVNVGFSGGETKRSELLQLLVQQPSMVLLDEPESGVDLENIVPLGKGCKQLLENSKLNGGLVITHTGHILDFVHTDKAHIMFKGRIHCQGDPMLLLQHIRTNGYKGCFDCHTMESVQSPLPADIEDVQESGSYQVKKSALDSEVLVFENNNLVSMKGGKLALEDQDDPSVQRNTNSVTSVNSGIVKLDLEDDELSINGLASSSGRYQQFDQEVSFSTSATPGLEVLNLQDALTKYHWIERDYLWKCVKPDQDANTTIVKDYEDAGGFRGYVIIAHENCKLQSPVDAALLMGGKQNQFVHNLLIARPGSELHVISSCKDCHKHGEDPELVTHYGISEFFVDENAKLSFTMVHSFCEKYTVYPRSASLVKANGVFLSNYCCLSPVGKVQMYPKAILDGANATARFSSVVIAYPGSLIDFGSRALLNHPNTRAEMVSRIISKGGKVYARGHIVGAVNETRGHIECQGLVLSGNIHAIPEIEGQVEGTELSHEAAVGKIAREKLEYVMARGLSEAEAVSVIIQGFLDVKIKGMPPKLQAYIDSVVSKAATGFC
eukprot:GCRY01000831.1.p1 GENE.GCRY01000831.1~~GCRY01000831.1.p1  ORF type:complete len:711 (+),score=151.53 GCRY01000831.1:92-2134(+)